MPAVVAEGLQKRFGDTHALRGVDLEIERATVLGVLGEPVLCEGQREISEYGGWRAYVASRAQP